LVDVEALILRLLAFLATFPNVIEEEVRVHALVVDKGLLHREG
jgi:hypothetical protein